MNEENEDEKVTIYNNGVKEGMKHTKSSPETIKRLLALETSATSIDKKLDIFMEKMFAHIEQEEKEQKHDEKDHLARDIKIDKILEQTQKTNGRVTAIELWRAQIKGGSNAVKGIWGVVGVFFIAVVFGMFQTYLAFQKLPATVSAEVTKQLQE